jgi:hypothetical protein
MGYATVLSCVSASWPSLGLGRSDGPQVRRSRSMDRKGRHPMRYRDDPILKAKPAEQRAQELPPDAKRQRRQRYMLGALGTPWYPRQPDTGQSAHGARLVFGLVVLGCILGIVAYLLVTR